MQTIAMRQFYLLFIAAMLLLANDAQAQQTACGGFFWDAAGWTFIPPNKGCWRGGHLVKGNDSIYVSLHRDPYSHQALRTLLFFANGPSIRKKLEPQGYTVFREEVYGTPEGKVALVKHRGQIFGMFLCDQVHDAAAVAEVLNSIRLNRKFEPTND